MSKERLKELLDDLPYSIRHSGEIEPLKQFAREQAERVKVLNSEMDQLILDERELSGKIGKLKRENNLYKQALEFYADEENYNSGCLTDDGRIKTLINGDNGEMARQALKGESE